MRMGLGLGINEIRGRGAAPRNTDLGLVLNTTILDLDATIAASYSTGQTWANLAATPFDGSAQTDFDAWLGLNSSTVPASEPVFTGTADSPGAYWAFDGGDYMTMKLATQNYFRKQPRSVGGIDVWMACAVYIPTGGTGEFFNSRLNSPSTGINFNKSMSIQTGNANSSGFLEYAPSKADDWNLFIMSFPANGGVGRSWVNTRVGVDDPTFGFNAWTTDRPDTQCHIGTINSGFGYLTAGHRMAGLYMGQEYLDNTRAGLLIDAINARHNRAYA